MNIWPSTRPPHLVHVVFECPLDCQIWSCYKHTPSGKNGNYLTIVAIALGILALLCMVILTTIGIRIVCRSGRQPIAQSQEGPESRSQNAIQNRNSYFSINSSSSENFDVENLELEERRPIIRPRLRETNVQQ